MTIQIFLEEMQIDVAKTYRATNIDETIDDKAPPTMSYFSTKKTLKK